MSVEIKILQPEDRPLLSRVAADVFDDPIDPDAAGAFLEDPRHLIAVALDQGLVVGFVSAVTYLHPDKPRPELWINEVGVAPSHQRRGLGKALMRAVCDRGRELHCSEAWVLTERDNSPATRLYAACGGREDDDDIVMFTFPLDEGSGASDGGRGPSGGDREP